MVAMRSPIPPAIREELSNDPYMTHCIFDDKDCAGRTEWHHAFRYQGRRVNELWSIIPLCHFHHGKAGTKKIDQVVNNAIRARIDHFDDFVRSGFYKKYPRSNLFAPKSLPTLKVDIIKR